MLNELILKTTIIVQRTNKKIKNKKELNNNSIISFGELVYILFLKLWSFSWYLKPISTCKTIIGKSIFLPAFDIY